MPICLPTSTCGRRRNASDAEAVGQRGQCFPCSDCFFHPPHSRLQHATKCRAGPGEEAEAKVFLQPLCSCLPGRTRPGKLSPHDGNGMSWYLSPPVACLGSKLGWAFVISWTGVPPFPRIPQSAAPSSPIQPPFTEEADPDVPYDPDRSLPHKSTRPGSVATSNSAATLG
ncbi:hypothetical protein GQ53DRAFT_428823 [Thozetella sp. PMI_491]|nr:hypothetical protein GQ53DRAFT_428823 [Thozetella sp. PMI_491]